MFDVMDDLLFPLTSASEPAVRVFVLRTLCNLALGDVQRVRNAVKVHERLLTELCREVRRPQLSRWATRLVEALGQRPPVLSLAYSAGGSPSSVGGGSPAMARALVVGSLPARLSSLGSGVAAAALMPMAGQAPVTLDSQVDDRT